jgi:hypothetical protein
LTKTGKSAPAGNLPYEPTLTLIECLGGTDDV